MALAATAIGVPGETVMTFRVMMWCARMLISLV
jgi:hypothetical protein